jgi:hypothetical protein
MVVGENVGNLSTIVGVPVGENDGNLAASVGALVPSSSVLGAVWMILK